MTDTLWALPTPVTDIDLAFPARGDQLTPEFATVPDEFKHQRNPWVQFVNYWLFRGDPFQAFDVYGPANDIDGDLAVRHIKVVLGTYATKHEHKVAGAAYLMSLWFLRIEKKPAEKKDPESS